VLAQGMNASVVIKDGKFFAMPEVFNDMGGTTPAAIIIAGDFDPSSKGVIGEAILSCLRLAKDYEKPTGWNAPSSLDRKLHEFGYRSYDALRRNAKFVYVDTADDTLTFYPTRRHGRRSPNFEGIGEVTARSLSPDDLGDAFKLALQQDGSILALAPVRPVALGSVANRNRKLRMPYGITLKSCNTTAVEILRLWEEASIFEPSGSMQELGYPPHVTLAVFAQWPQKVSAVMSEVFSAQKKLSITFDAVDYFDNDCVVLWAKPRANPDLSRLHHRLHSHFDTFECHEHYRVGQWTPHCSLATKVPQSAKSAATAWANSRKLAFSVEFDFADFVQFPPVVIHEELRLG
jgi:2'-5' RNA ligase